MIFEDAMREIENLLRQKEQLMNQKAALDKRIYDVDKQINDVKQREVKQTSQQQRSNEISRNARPSTPGQSTPPVPGIS